VILNAAGPFYVLAPPVVDACIRKRTDYCDSIDFYLHIRLSNILVTGESWFVRKMIDKYHREAEDNGTLIGMTSPFHLIIIQSLLADMTVFLLTWVLGL